MIGRLRRSGSATTAAPDNLIDARRGDIERLQTAGWVLPRSLVGDTPPVGTRLGVDSGATTALVDGRGAVSPAPGRPSLDWAVGADDRWYVPAVEPGVSQVRVDHAPVVQTAMRVPGGQVTQRAYALRGPGYPGGDEWVVIEVTNDSSLPVALAWLIRPWDGDRLLNVPEVKVRPQAGSGPAWHVWADGLAAVLPRRPSRWADGHGSDPLAQVTSGEASTDWNDVVVSADDGLASVALLVPLPHTATATIVVPVNATPDAEQARTVGWPEARPDVDAVVRGWSSMSDRGPRIELPDPVLADAVAGARRSILLAHRTETATPDDTTRAAPVKHRITASGQWGTAGRLTPIRDQMEILSALAWWGHDDAVDRALVDWPEGQRRGGGFGDVASTTWALCALSRHAVASGDPGPARVWLPELSGAVEWLAREARRSPDPDRRLIADGLDSASVLLALLGQPEPARRLAVDADAHWANATATAPRADLDRASLAARDLADDAVAATRAGDEAAAVWALLRRASSTWTWSDRDHWVADDALVQARLLTAVARLLVNDRPDGLELTTWLPPAWFGLGWEVHGAPTRWGQVSYAVRWHGSRPAILWDLGEPLDGIADVVVRAPALDPTWSSTERRGEALLAEVTPPFDPEAAEDLEGEPTAARGVAIAAPPRSVWRPQDPGPDAPTAAAGTDVPAADVPEADSHQPPNPTPDGGSFS